MAFTPDWSKEERALFRSSFSSLEFGTQGRAHALRDNELKELFDKAIIHYIDEPIDKRLDNQQALEEYLDHEYGIIFDEDFDWEGYREWYDSL